QVFARGDVGNHGTAGGLEESRHYGFQQQERIDEPDHRGGADQEHRKHDDHASEVGDDHHVLAAQPVIDDARGGSDKGLRQNLQHEGEGDGTGAAGELQQQSVNGQGIEPIANLADDLGHPKPAEIEVTAQQASVGGERNTADFDFG